MAGSLPIMLAVATSARTTPCGVLGLSDIGASMVEGYPCRPVKQLQKAFAAIRSNSDIRRVPRSTRNCR